FGSTGVGTAIATQQAVSDRWRKPSDTLHRCRYGHSHSASAVRHRVQKDNAFPAPGFIHRCRQGHHTGG
ncbi:MAG: hypothetical protein RIB71_27445, partial [Imperialibacter sp.]|uniref:hypothetical protein n=1 Tax=Imperialibacter sp. TaxID=2038411 RepID=UPI0032EE2B59